MYSNDETKDLDFLNLFASTDKERKKQIKKIISKSLELTKLMQSLKITWDELLLYLPEFLDVKNYLDNPSSSIYKFSVERNQKNELVFKKTFNDKVSDFLNIQKYLWLSDFDEIDVNLRLNKTVVRNINSQKEIENKLQLIKENNPLGGLYISSSDSINNSKYAQSIAIDFAMNKMSSVYIKTSTLFAKLKSGFVDKNNKNPEIIKILKSADILVLDGFGSENINKWFLFDILNSILTARILSNKVTIFFSLLSIEQLFEYYNKNSNISQDAHKLSSFINLIKKHNSTYSI